MRDTGENGSLGCLQFERPSEQMASFDDCWDISTGKYNWLSTSINATCMTKVFIYQLKFCSEILLCHSLCRKVPADLQKGFDSVNK